MIAEHGSAMRAGVARFLLILLLLIAPPAPSWAEDWRNLVQPQGTLAVVETAAVVNARLGGIPPFDAATDVTTINTSVQQYFVRFYNPTDPLNPSNPVGSWIMRAATVRGLTPAQVRDLFALPSMPTHMTIVRVPAGYNLYTGIAAPIAGWGDGGGQQSKLIGPPWVAAGNFLNQLPVMSSILSYRLRAGSGNTERIAAYLDGRIPSAYSDFENVYLSLDLLYTDALAGQFRSALDQIGPARYDHLTAESLWAARLYNETVDERLSAAFLRRSGAGGTPEDRKGQGRLWLKFVGGVQRAGDLGFNTESRGVVIGGDRAVSDRALAGFSLGFLHSGLDWTSPGGGARTDSARGGLYGAVLERNFFLQACLNAGYSQVDADRRIDFPGVNRTASARFDGWEVNPRLRAGFRLPTGILDIVPVAGLDYFHQVRSGFTEGGADSINLQVNSTGNHTLRSHIGIEASKDVFLRKDTSLKPLLRIGWAREVPLDNRGITARFAGQADDFTVNGESRTADILTTCLGVTLTRGERFSFVAQFGMDLRQDATDRSASVGMNYRF